MTLLRFGLLAGILAAAALSPAESPPPPRQETRPAPSTAPADLPAGLERVLARVPDDARAVVIVPSLAGLTSGVAAFGKAVDVSQLEEFTATEMLSELLEESAAPIDPAGPLVLAFAPDYDEPVLLALAQPTESWRSKARAAELRPGIPLYDFGADRYLVATDDGLIFFGRERADLRRALDSRGALGRKLPAVMGAALPARQVAAYVDVPAWSEMLQAQLNAAMRQVLMGVSTGEPEAEVAMQVLAWARGQLESTIGQAEALVASVQVNEAGVLAESRATFKAGSEIRKYLQQVRPAEQSPLRGLLAADATLVFGYEWQDAAGSEGPQMSLTRAILSMDPLRTKLGTERIAALLARSGAVHGRMSGTNFALAYEPAGHGLLYWGMYFSAEPAAMLADVRVLYDQTPELMNALGMFPTGMERGESEQVAGATVDVYRLQMKPATAAARRMSEPTVEALYGKEATLYVAPHAAGLAYALGPRTAARRKLEQVLGGGAPLAEAPRVKAALARLNPRPQVIGLVDLRRAFKDVCAVSEQIGFPLPRPQLPPGDAALAALGIYLEPDAIRLQGFIPSEPIAQLSAALDELGENGAE
ncbi:MAG: hypothetical protein AB1716_06320 [Planctomycetota bacterium]